MIFTLHTVPGVNPLLTCAVDDIQDVARAHSMNTKVQIIMHHSVVVTKVFKHAINVRMSVFCMVLEFHN